MCARRLHAWSGMWKWLQALWHDWWLVLRASQRDRTQVLREAWVAFQEGDSHDSRVLLDWLVRSSRNTDELAQLLDIRSTVREHQNDLVGAIDDAEGALPVGETSPAPRLDTYRIERLKWKEAVGRAGRATVRPATRSREKPRVLLRVSLEDMAIVSEPPRRCEHTARGCGRGAHASRWRRSA